MPSGACAGAGRGRRDRPHAGARAAGGRARSGRARDGAQEVDHLAGERDEDLDAVGGSRRHLLLRGVAVEDGGDLVPEEEGYGKDALGVSTEAGQGLRGARRVAHVRARRVPRAVRRSEDGVRGERDGQGLDRVVVVEAARVPAHGRVVLDDEHGDPIDALRHFGDEVGEHLGEVGALLDRRDRRLEAGVVGGRRGLLLSHHLGHRGRDRLLVELLVVAGHLLAQLVERAHERGLVSLDGALDLDDPVGHLLADEGGGACLQVVFEAHFPLADARKIKQNPDLRPRALSGTRTGVSTITPHW